MYLIMKGLEDYIKKNGFHFTVNLALDATDNKWNEKKVCNAAEKRVYYNVIDASLGDMVYITNAIRHNRHSIDKCIEYTLMVVGNFDFYGGKIFMDWLDTLVRENKDFDFTEYM